MCHAAAVGQSASLAVVGPVLEGGRTTNLSGSLGPAAAADAPDFRPTRACVVDGDSCEPALSASAGGASVLSPLVGRVNPLTPSGVSAVIMSPAGSASLLGRNGLLSHDGLLPTSCVLGPGSQELLVDKTPRRRASAVLPALSAGVVGGAPSLATVAGDSSSVEWSNSRAMVPPSPRPSDGGVVVGLVGSSGMSVSLGVTSAEDGRVAAEPGVVPAHSG